MYFLASETGLISGGSDKQLILWEWNGTGTWNNQVSRSNLFLKLLPTLSFSHTTNYLFCLHFLFILSCFTLTIEPRVHHLQIVDVLSCYVLLVTLFLLFCSLTFFNSAVIKKLTNQSLGGFV